MNNTKRSTLAEPSKHNVGTLANRACHAHDIITTTQWPHGYARTPNPDLIVNMKSQHWLYSEYEITEAHVGALCIFDFFRVLVVPTADVVNEALWLWDRWRWPQGKPVARMHAWDKQDWSTFYCYQFLPCRSVYVAVRVWITQQSTHFFWSLASAVANIIQTSSMNTSATEHTHVRTNLDPSHTYGHRRARFYELSHIKRPSCNQRSRRFYCNHHIDVGHRWSLVAFRPLDLLKPRKQVRTWHMANTWMLRSCSTNKGTVSVRTTCVLIQFEIFGWSFSSHRNVYLNLLWIYQFVRTTEPLQFLTCFIPSIHLRFCQTGGLSS